MATIPVPVAFAGAGTTKVDFTLGSVDIATGYTYMAVIYPRDVAAYHALLQVVTSTDTDCVSMEISPSATIVGSVDASEITYSGLSSMVVNEWYIVGITKPSGSATARGHRYRFSNTTWSHADHVGAIADTARTAANIQVGEWQNSTVEPFDGFGAVWAIWNSDLSDVQIETLTTNLNAWQALAPNWWAIGNGATAMVDESGGTGNETSREAGVTSGSSQTSPLLWSGQTLLPDADIVTTGWATAPLFSKINDASDATVITATAA